MGLWLSSNISVLFYGTSFICREFAVIETWLKLKLEATRALQLIEKPWMWNAYRLQMHSQAWHADWVYVWFVLIVQHHFSSLSTILKTCCALKLLSPRTSKVSTKQSEPGSTSAIHFKQSFVACCYKHTWCLSFGLRESNFCFQTPKPCVHSFNILPDEKMVKDTIKLYTACKNLHKLLLSTTVDNSDKVKLLDFGDPIEGNSDRYSWKLACNSAWLYTRNINGT